MEDHMKTALVCGAGGFIGNHMVNRLKNEGYFVRGVDIKHPEYSSSSADEFVIQDLREREAWDTLLIPPVNDQFDEIYQFSADMGGAGYIFTGMHDADIMHNSATINLNCLDAMVKRGKKFHNISATKIFYSSSACMYPEHNQQDPLNPQCREDSAYPANPDSEYGWEKLFSERLFLSYSRNYGIPVRVARFHNIFGPLGTWQGGKEKAPAAICRKVATAGNDGVIEVWGDGQQTRSFLYVDECIEGVKRLMEGDFQGPVNIGSDEMVTINQLVEMIAEISGRTITINHIDGPLGVRGRNSDNALIKKQLGWAPNTPLADGLAITYQWICQQLDQAAQ
jgi:nucleoside-diphosphate-sugar epimerase